MNIRKRERSYRRPAIIYKDEIVKKVQSLWYSEDMFYYYGSPGTTIFIRDNPDIGENTYNYQWAIVDKDENLIGYIGYNHNCYTNNVSNFGLVSFDKGNPCIGYALEECFYEMVMVRKVHRIEYGMIEGNPIYKHYKKFCDAFGGREMIFRDTAKNKYGEYINDYIFEIIDPYDHIIKGNENK